MVGLKPLHLVIIIGENIHTNHLALALKRKIDSNVVSLDLADLPISGPDALGRILSIDYGLKEHASRDMHAIVLLRGVEPSNTALIDTIDKHFQDRVTFLVIETDPEKLARELAMTKRDVIRLQASLEHYEKTSSAAKRAIGHIKHQRVAHLDHRRSLEHQARYAHFRIAVRTNRKLPYHH